MILSAGSSGLCLISPGGGGYGPAQNQGGAKRHSKSKVSNPSVEKCNMSDILDSGSKRASDSESEPAKNAR